MAVPTTPHLNWGGTTCPGERWREWVPQLRTQALEEDGMTPEEHQLLEAIHHQSTVMEPAEHKAILEMVEKVLWTVRAGNNAAGEAAEKTIWTVRAGVQTTDKAAAVRHEELLDAIAAIGAVDGPSADAIAAKIADNLAERLLRL